MRGFVPGTCKKRMGCSEMGGGGVECIVGERRETDTHRWRADDQKLGGRRTLEKIDGRGRR